MKLETLSGCTETGKYFVVVEFIVSFYSGIFKSSSADFSTRVIYVQLLSSIAMNLAVFCHGLLVCLSAVQAVLLRKFLMHIHEVFREVLIFCTVNNHLGFGLRTFYRL